MRYVGSTNTSNRKRSHLMNRFPALIVTLFLTTGCSASMKIKWTEGPNLPQPLGGHVAAVLPEGMVVAGGSNWPAGTKIWRDEIYVLDQSAATWRPRAKLPAGMTLPAAGVKHDTLLFLGGWLEKGATGETFSYAGGEVKRSVTPALPQGRAQASAVCIDGDLYVIGGLTDGADFNTAMPSVIRLTPGEQQWRDRAPLPKPIGLSSIIALGNRIYLFGGMGPVGGTLADSDDALCYEPENNRWIHLAPLPFARRGAAIVAIDDRHILLIGGCHNIADKPQMLSDVLLYDTRTDRYQKLKPLPLAALCEQAVVADGKILVIGGEDLPKHRTDRVLVGQIVNRGS
jgi:N-acetylneuraminic acid mutarotase